MSITVDSATISTARALTGRSMLEAGLLATLPRGGAIAAPSRAAPRPRKRRRLSSVSLREVCDRESSLAGIFFTTHHSLFSQTRATPTSFRQAVMARPLLFALHATAEDTRAEAL